MDLRIGALYRRFQQGVEPFLAQPRPAPKAAIRRARTAIRADLPPDEGLASRRQVRNTRPLSCIAFVILIAAAMWACLLYAAEASLPRFGALF